MEEFFLTDIDFILEGNPHFRDSLVIYALLNAASISINKNKLWTLMLSLPGFVNKIMTISSDIDSRNSDLVSDDLDTKIRRKRNLIKKKAKKRKKDLKKLKTDKFLITSGEYLTIRITDRVRKKLLV